MSTAKTSTRQLKPTAQPKLPRSAKAAAKPVAKTASKAAPAAKTVVVAKPAKLKKDKLVRDSFTIPKSEYLVIESLKQRAAKLGKPAKKSELIRAGFKTLAAMNDAALTTALGNVPAIKTGRPGKV